MVFICQQNIKEGRTKKSLLDMKASKKSMIEFDGEKAVGISRGQSILDASLSAGIPHFHSCGGNARCSTCRVLVLEGIDSLTSPNAKESFLKNQMHFPPNVRLACQTRVVGAAVKVKRIIRDVTDIGLYVGSAAGDSTQELGEEKIMALLFFDIRNFTQIMENHPAFDVIHIIRKLFSSFQSRIEFNKGNIVETTGDGLYAVFDHEKRKGQNAQSAVQAAAAMLEDLETLNETYFIPYFEERIEAGIGIHLGKVVSGTVRVGVADHWFVMGYAVNIASRLQAATKELNNNLIVSSEIYDLMNDPPSMQPKSVVLKGITNPLMVYPIGKPYVQKISNNSPIKKT
jgi:adenylate cyclase